LYKNIYLQQKESKIMVMSNLHIICGNCGCNYMFEYEVDPTGHDISGSDDQFAPAVYITCKNCATIHDLADTITIREEE
jgi:predicted nucleic-acid-binding Zn-ribbon protein